MDLDDDELWATQYGNRYVKKSKIRERLKKLKEKEQELSDEQGYWGSSELQARIEELEQLLEG